MGASIDNTRGFTLVEISIVMIIIGLLIGGTFGGMKLIENMQVNKTAQDLKAIESAALTFRDTYGRLPGDMPNSAARLPNCTVAPCATGGNGDRVLDVGLGWADAITSASERFTFWHHLQAANLISMSFSNTLNMEFDEGQPSTPLDGGYRIGWRNPPSSLWNPAAQGTPMDRALVFLTPIASGPAVNMTAAIYPCGRLQQLDAKMDDGLPFTGAIQAECYTALAAGSPYRTDISRWGYFELRGF